MCYNNMRLKEIVFKPAQNVAVNLRRGMAQLVARLSGGQEAVSSSLATPTRIPERFRRTNPFGNIFLPFCCQNT